MQLVYKGKTKDVYRLPDGNFELRFKDDVTGADGVFDPGANQVGARIAGNGLNCLRLTKYFFELLAEAGIHTHYISSDPENVSMVVLPCQPFGKGLEVVLRYKAVGSFYRRYPDYCSEGQDLPGLVEMTFKDDLRNDPLVLKDTLVMLSVMSADEYELLKETTLRIGKLIAAALAAKGLQLYDIKFEYGRDAQGRLLLMDEISAGNMRCYKDGKAQSPEQIVRLMLDEA
ncbi:MAG: phosphoribosylaminoimidazolesuccinocarboxamide synthase [Lentisphaeria bacterium]|jgi:phosphoribosylaminoimidazole-succinocarboxamide synthase|nr:phosphoribosylaminoimidazolesuccinocarboxamide synthase [Lentisphaeria bacterium]MDY0176981.1 phosphoribosylaminoimidazolesuccinocarboxamide synthase [Lentisphaeria bacterium]